MLRLFSVEKLINCIGPLRRLENGCTVSWFLLGPRLVPGMFRLVSVAMSSVASGKWQ